MFRDTTLIGRRGQAEYTDLNLFLCVSRVLHRHITDQWAVEIIWETFCPLLNATEVAIPPAARNVNLAAESLLPNTLLQGHHGMPCTIQPSVTVSEIDFDPCILCTIFSLPPKYLFHHFYIVSSTQ